MRGLLVSVWMVLLLSSSCQESKQASQSDRFQEILDSTYTANPGSHGLVLAIDAQSEVITWTNAVGWADSAADLKLQANTPVLIASITKTYMAAAALRLCELYPVKIDSAIKSFIRPKTDSLLRADGYKTDKITLAHLLTNSSGIADFVETEEYQTLSKSEPHHIWTRQEQIRLTVCDTEPLGEPGSLFHYSDINFLLVGEILEHFTKKPFYHAVRELLEFEKNGLHHTWWNMYEDEEAFESLPLALQSARSYQVDSRSLHPSFDLFGAGGIVSTAPDLARFSSLLFAGAFFQDSTSLDLLTSIKAPPGSNTDHRLGLMAWEHEGHQAFGYGGFWGTMFQYYPDIETSIVVFSMEREYWRETIELSNQIAQEIREKKK